MPKRELADNLRGAKVNERSDSALVERTVAVDSPGLR